MDTLLINPNSRKPDSVEELPLITPPINLMYVAQSLNDNGFKARIVDSLAHNYDDKQILSIIRKSDSETIGFPLYSSDLSMMHRLTAKIKEADDSRKIFFAGHHASALHTEIMKQFPNVDFIIRGEGEFTTPEMIDAIEKDKLEEVKGITYRRDGRVHVNPDSRPIDNLDDVPIPSRKLIEPKLYYSKMSKREKVDIAITARGCPFRCTFCAKLNEKFRSYRERSIPNIMEELSQIAESGTNGLEVYDEMFTLKKKRVDQFVKAIRKERLDFEFRIRTRVTHVDRAMLTSLKQAGCSTVSYGVESGNQQVLDGIGKDITLAQVEQAFRETEKAGLNVLGFFMIGNRGDTPETIRETIDFAKKLNPLFATFGVLHPYPSTYDYEYARHNRTLIGEYAPFKPLPWMKLPWTRSIEDLYKYSSMAYEEYYRRPAYVGKFMSSVISQGNWNLARYTLGNFYKKISRINAI